MAKEHIRGKVLAYDDMQGHGLISGDDGRRYAFVRGSLGVDSRMVRPGQDVDFQVAGDQALYIYVIGGYVIGGPSGQIGQKSKIAAGLFALFLGGLGIHKFYIGGPLSPWVSAIQRPQINAGVIMLLVSIFGSLFPALTIAMVIIGAVEGVIYFTKTNQDFYKIYEVGQKAWF